MSWSRKGWWSAFARISQENVKGHGGFGNPVFRAEHAQLFGVPCHEEDGSLGWFWQECQGFGQLEHSRDSAGIVVGTVMDESHRPATVSPVAVAHVIVVGTDENHLVFQAPIASFQ